MGDKDVIDHRLEALEKIVQQMFVDKMVLDELKKYINDLQRDQEGLIQKIRCISVSVEGLNRKVSMLEETLATKADITHVQQTIEQSKENSQND
ncbi:TPA: hypothetical protein ACGW44_004700 [Bacillus toyonensis]